MVTGLGGPRGSRGSWQSLTLDLPPTVSFTFSAPYHDGYWGQTVPPCWPGEGVGPQLPVPPPLWRRAQAAPALGNN